MASPSLNEVLEHSYWLFGLCTTSGKYQAVHIPLVYSSSFRMQQELYAKALLAHVEFLGLEEILEPKLVDGVVFLFKRGTLDLVKCRALHLLVDSQSFCTNVLARIRELVQNIEHGCLDLERRYLEGDSIYPSAIADLLSTLADSVSLSFLNPFVEHIALSARALQQDEECRAAFTVLDASASSTFSHLLYFHNEWQQLVAMAAEESEPLPLISDFCWRVGFLGNPSNDGSPYESPEYVSERLGANIQQSDAQVDAVLYRNPNLPLAWPNRDLCTVEDNLILRNHALLANLSILEEFRHYWQARAMRTFRCMLPEDRPLYEKGLAYATAAYTFA